MTIDAVRAGLPVEEVELPLEHRATGRDARGFLHRGRQLADAVLATGPLRVNYRGLRAHLRAGRTTGVLKLAGIPLYGLIRTRSVSGALFVGLAANALNQLDT